MILTGLYYLRQDYRINMGSINQKSFYKPTIVHRKYSYILLDITLYTIDKTNIILYITNITDIMLYAANIKKKQIIVGLFTTIYYIWPATNWMERPWVIYNYYCTLFTIIK